MCPKPYSIPGLCNVAMVMAMMVTMMIRNRRPRRLGCGTQLVVIEFRLQQFLPLHLEITVPVGRVLNPNK